MLACFALDKCAASGAGYRLTVVVLIFAAALLSGCIGPSGSDDDALPAWPGDEMYDAIRAEPSKLELYPAYVDMQFASGDATGLRDTAEFCVKHNPRIARAWLLKARVMRLLHHFGETRSLIETESALLEAARLAQRDPEVGEALASFYRDTWQPAKERESRVRLLEYADDARRPTAHLALAQLDYRMGDMVAARLAVPNLSIDSFGAWLFKLRLSVEDGGVESSLDLIGQLPQPGGKAPGAWYDVLLRLVSSARDAASLNALAAHMRQGLTLYEDPRIRFSCQFGLWCVGWMREALSDAPGRPPDDATLAARLDAIDGEQPDWLRRAFMAACAVGDANVAKALAERLERAGQSEPPRVRSLADLRLAWQAEDAVRLGMTRSALTHVKNLRARSPEQDELLLAECGLMLETGDAPGAAATAEVVKGRAPHIAAALTALRWQALIRSGNVKDAMREMRSAAALPKERQLPFDPAVFAWLTAVAVLHASVANEK